MKKLITFILADFIGFLVFIPTSFYLIFEHLRSFRFTGDEKMAFIFQYFLFIIINIVFVIPQITMTLSMQFSEDGIRRRLNSKSIVFCCHTIVLFSFSIYTQIIRFNYNDPEVKYWIYVLVGFVLGSSLIYYLYMLLLRKIFK